MTVAVTPRDEPEAPPSYVRSEAWTYLASLPVDRKLYRYDLAGSIAHAEMLGECGILSPADVSAIGAGLRRVNREIEAGAFPWREDLEDVHTNIEVRLRELLGPVAAKLHTARSRNDQIALDERLYLRDAVQEVQLAIVSLQTAFLDRAERHIETRLPGYTHLQRAQPVTLAHHLLARFWALARDFDRLSDADARANVSPLGAGALAGTTLPIDPQSVAHRLGFAATFENSIDAVSDRDYFAEFLFDLTVLAVHLSSIGEEWVLWSSTEFAFLRTTAALGAGSSAMPQKRNPDVAELARAKAARVLGHLTSLLATLKSLPLGYHRDLQEDKGPVFESVDHVLRTLDAFAAAVPSLHFEAERMAEAADDRRLLATDLVEYLASKGVPFREAHDLVGRYEGTTDGPWSAAGLQAFDPRFGSDVVALLDPRDAVRRRSSPGGPAPTAVRIQLARARDVLGLEQYVLSKRAERANVIAAILTEEPT